MKNYFNIIAIIISSFLASTGMILMKIAMDEKIDFFILFTSLIIYSIAVLLFLFLLSKMKYIIVMSSLSLPYIFSYILSVIYLDEKISTMKNIAVILIITGVLMISLKGKNKI